MLELETSQKASQSFLLWIVSSLELRDLGRANQPPLPSPHTNHNSTRDAAQHSFMKIQCQGNMVPSSVGLAAPAEITERCIKDESEPASLGPPHILAQGLQPQMEGHSPCTSQILGTPRSCPSSPAGGQSLPQEWAPCQRWAWGRICIW